VSVFARSILSDAPEIGGVRLKAFSAFHALALLELDSPYILGGRDPEWGDTIAALLVCSSVRGDKLGKVLQWHTSPFRAVRWWLYTITHNHAKIGNELAEHIVGSIEFPPVWEKTGGDREHTTKSGANWAFYIVSVVARSLHGIKYNELWDMPLSELICHKAIIAEENGDIEIAESELKNIKKRRELRAE